MKTLYIGSDNTVMLTCPGCDKAKMIDVSNFLVSDGPVTLTYRFQCDTCNCGHDNCRECLRENCTLGQVNTINLERRKNARRVLLLPGMFLLGGTDPLKVKILDISRKGVRVESFSHSLLHPGSSGLIEFQLNDRNQTHIRKEVLVKRVAENIAVLMFQEGNTYSVMDKAIGFYLMSSK